MRKTAMISSCNTYRYSLTRCWDENKPGVLWIMLNPSTADADTDDPTIRRCIAFAKAWDCGSIAVVNLFAYRATDPAVLASHAKRIMGYRTAVGPDNDNSIRSWVDAHSEPGDIIIAAWGVHAGRPSFRLRRDHVIEMLPLADLNCLEVTRSGEPKHPLYCRADLTPCRYEVKR